MKFDVFPNEYKERVDRDTIAKIDKNIQENQEAIQKIVESIEVASRKKAQSVMSSMFSGAVCGLIVGFIVSLAVYLAAKTKSHDQILEKFAFFFPIILGAVIGRILGTRAACNENSRLNLILQDKRDFEKRNIEAKIEAQRMTVVYAYEFEQAAKAEATKYVNSKLAAEVVSWMTQYFAKSIADVRREIHTEQIVVPFFFCVFSDRITCSNGTFDFISKRCENLSSRVEQAALAKVIASALQLQASMLYPRDPSGTDNIIDVEYSYRNNSADVTMKYSAANGYFEPKRSWTL